MKSLQQSSTLGIVISFEESNMYLPKSKPAALNNPNAPQTLPRRC